MIQSYMVQNANIFHVTDGTLTTGNIVVENGIVQSLDGQANGFQGEIIDATGLTITTGWVDAHCHFYYDAVDNIGVNPQLYFLPFGVTYGVDAGTAGADVYEDFRSHVGWSTDLQFKSYLNIAKTGVPIVGAELLNMDNLDEDACKKMFLKYRHELQGLKVRITSNFCVDPLTALQSIRKMADELQTTICVHATRCDLSTETILSYMKSGDVITHIYTRTESGILNEDGTIKDCVWEARKRGVIFDLGHGSASFAFDVANRAIAQGFYPDMVSTDVHLSCVNGPVFDLSCILSKFLALGVDWKEAIRMVTVNPVQLLNLKDKQLDITVGQPADFTAFKVEEGEFHHMDVEKTQVTCQVGITSKFTCVGNKIFTPTRIRQPNQPIGLAALKAKQEAEKANA